MMISFKSAKEKRQDKVIKMVCKLSVSEYVGVCTLLGIHLAELKEEDLDLVPDLVIKKIRALNNTQLTNLKKILEDATRKVKGVDNVGAEQN